VRRRFGTTPDDIHPPRYDTTDVRLQLRGLSPVFSLYCFSICVKSVTCNAWYLHRIRPLTKALFWPSSINRKPRPCAFKSKISSRVSLHLDRPLSIESPLFSTVRSYLTFLQPLALWQLKRASVSRLHMSYAASDKDLSSILANPCILWQIHEL
jgi:hypothetical protein